MIPPPPDFDGWIEAIAVTLFGLVAALALVALLSGCGCKTAYLFDGSSGPGARPYYKVEVCKGQKPRVVCDSTTPLPSGGCK
jgi:hypothetical protein